MSWPYDARIRTYGAKQQVLSADLNDIQDKIVDLYRDRTIVIIKALPEYSPADAETWEWQDGLYWRCNDASAYLYFFIEAIPGYVLKKVEVKYSQAAATMTFNLYKADLNFNSPITEPTLGAAISTASPSGIGHVWNVEEMVVSSTITSDDVFELEVVNAAVADYVAGIRATYQPLTFTP